LLYHKIYFCILGKTTNCHDIMVKCPWVVELCVLCLPTAFLGVFVL